MDLQNCIVTDAVIVGAGPVGLFQVFELGLLEIHAHVIDSLARVGGQCAELYPHKPIYDIPALPVISGQGLIDNLLEQIKPFAPTFHLGQEVTDLVVHPENPQRFVLQTALGKVFNTRTIFIAGGVGSFQPRTLKMGGIEKYLNTQLFYRVQDPKRFAGRNIVICGGGDSALDWALNLVEHAHSVTLVHRRDEFRAVPASVAQMQALVDAHKMQCIIGQLSDFEEQNDQLSALKVTAMDGVTRRLPLDDLLVFYGLSPRLGPIANWGLEFDKRQIQVDTEKFQTNVPGIFAIGDINTYPGKKKLILSGFHEAAMAAFAAAELIFPEKKIHMQYTTTSTKIHKILGVDSVA